MRIFRNLILAAALCAPWFAAPVAAGEIVLPDPSMQVQVMSLQELRQSRVVRQDHDFSCGSAALATLLTYSYDQPVTEQEVFDTMYKVGDQDHIRIYGFSLLDMQKYLASRGLRAAGYKLTAEQFRNLRLPAIALISPKGYNHFVVVRGWQDDGVIVADPRLGLHRMSADEFQSVWNGIVFVLKDGQAWAQTRYNDPRDIRLLARAAPGQGMLYPREGLTGFFLNLPSLHDY